MIPVHGQVRSNSQRVKHIFGFFWPKILNRPRHLKIISLAIVSGLFIVGGSFCAAMVISPWGFRDYVIEKVLEDKIKLLSVGASILLEPNIVRRVASTYMEDLETFDIDITFKRFRQLEIFRELALNAEDDNIQAKSGPNVKAVATYDGKRVPIKIRLKGQMIGAHFGCEDCLKHSDGKPSYRATVRRGETILGMSRFALMSPARRGFLHSWVFRQALLREGIISKRYVLVRLVINGDNKGVYMIDEHFDNKLFEHAKRPDSVVVRFHNPWNDTPGSGANPSDDEYFSLSYPESYQWFHTPAYSAYLDRAIHLLDEFVNGTYTVSEVFDMDLFARYFALADVFGAWHGLGWANLRFYFNPVTGLLEPIPDDSFNEVATRGRDRLIRLDDTYNSGKFLKRFIADRQFVNNYMEELDRISRPSYLEEFWSALSTDLESRINVIRRDHPLYDFRYRAKQTSLIGVLQGEGVGMDEIDYQASLIRSMLFKEGSDYQLGSGIQISDLYDRNKTGFTAKRCLVQLKKMGNVPEFVRIDPITSEIHIARGSHTLSKDLVIPKGCPLIVFDGTQLLLENGAFIVSRSPVYFFGTTDSPIYIVSSDAQGGGLLVMNSPERSEIAHTYFSGLSNGGNGSRFLNGAVTFYRSDVMIDSTVFDSNIAGDDYLNIIASQYLIKNSSFENTISDGFDSDYSDGRIEDVRLENIGIDDQLGGDGLDFSGSNALIKNTQFSQVSDKAVSVGEGSKVKIENIVVLNATNAIVSKDGSVVEVEDATLKHLDRALVAIKKKSGYGPAILTVKRLSFDSVDTPYLLEEGSTLRIDGANVEPNTNQGKAVIYQ